MARMLKLWRILDGELARDPRSFGSLAEVLGSLAEARGTFVLEGSLGPSEALAVADAVASAEGRLRVGIVPSPGRPVDHYVAPGDGTPGEGQLIFDGLRCGVGVAGARTLRSGDPGVAEALGLATDCLYFVGHSTGNHMDVAGRVLSRCHVLDPATAERGWTCAHGDPCVFDGVLFDPARLSARRIVALTCWGIRLDHLYDDASSVGRAILDNPTVRSYVTSVRVIRVSKSELELAYFLVNAGLCSGDVANELNRFRLRDGKLAEYVCLGNPEQAGEARVVDGTATALEPGVLELRFDGGAAGDYRFALPIDEAPERVVLVEQGRFPEAMVLHGSQLFVSYVEPPPAVVRVRIVDWSGLVFDHGLPAALLAELPATAFFAHAPGIDAATRAQVAERSASLRELLSAWPFFGLLPSAAVPAAAVELHRRRLEGLLGGLATSILEGYRQLTRGGGIGGAVVSGSVWARLGSVRRYTHATCHCGHAVVRFHHEGLLGPVRVVSYCDRCGLVHDGDPELAEGLVAPPVGVLGGTLSLSVQVRNPHATRCTARAVALLQAPRVADSVEGPPVQVVLPPRHEGPVTLQLTLDAPFTIPATYVLGACVVVGAHFVFLRSHVQLQRPSQGDLAVAHTVPQRHDDHDGRPR